MNNLQFMRHQLYMLKREYGLETGIYRTIVEETNLETGAKRISIVKNTIDQAIFVPVKFETMSLYSASYLKAAREFAYGGYQDQEVRKVIIDGNDVADDFEILPDDYLVQNHKKYEIKYAEKLEEGIGYLMIVQRLVGAEVAEVHEARVFQSIRFLQSVVRVP